MLNSQWPSFFGHIIDYYLKPGGAYYGAKQGLKPINIVFDYYATGDKSAARIHVTNQTLEPLTNVSASVSMINLDGTLKYTGNKDHLNVAPNSSVLALICLGLKTCRPPFSFAASSTVVTAGCLPKTSIGSQLLMTNWTRPRQTTRSSLHNEAGQISAL